MRTSFEPGAGAGDGIPLSVPVIGGREWEYVRECLDTGWVSSVGSYVDRFERELAALVGARHAVATVNGTAALHVALRVADVRPDDEVLVSTLTFIAPVNAIRYAGAWPLLVDAEPVYWQMDVEQVAAFLKHDCVERDGATWNKATGRRVSAVVPVHALGHAVDLDPLLELAGRHHLVVIEDASESLGSYYRGRHTGGIGHLGCFSFNGNKIVTTGGGGMVVTNHSAWAEKIRYLTTQAKDDPLEYVHHEIGYNYRLTNLQAAMGCAQLEQLQHFVDRRREIAERYRNGVAGAAGLTFMREAPWAKTNAWMSTVLVDESRTGLSSRALLQRLAERKIQSRPLWTPAHCNRPYAACQRIGSCQVAEALHREALSLPSTPSLTDAAQTQVLDALLENLASAS